MQMAFLCAGIVVSLNGADTFVGDEDAFVVDDTAGLGLRWEGIGAISGGGATTKLLMEYPEVQRAEVLDYLFKPGVGLSLQMLKVEIGGDTDATEGAEPSHMHSKGDEDYTRGYEWWLMKEAKARNPEIKLYGLPWGWPGWLDPAASPDKQARHVFADPTLTANYTLAWLRGAKRVHGLDIDYIGQWNERDAPHEYSTALRAAVNGSSLKTVVLNRLVHYPGTTDTPDAKGCTQYGWNSTNGEQWVDEEGSIFDGRSARCLARCVNRNYISGCHTATFQWHLVSSFYDYLPWARDGVAVANRPWDGSYEITSPTWALAHTTQFAPIGWRYAAHGAGVAMLRQGGSMVTRLSPDKRDWSMVLEKMSSVNSACARGSNPHSTSNAELVVVQLHGAFKKAAAGKTIALWRSDLSSSDSQGDNPPDEQLFQKGSVAVGADGRFTVQLQPNEIVTVTTLSTGGKGSYTSPPRKQFALPYRQDFDSEALSAPPHLFYDQMGAWQIDAATGGRSGRVMRQVVPVWPECWGYSCNGPTTFFMAPEIPVNSTVTLDVRLEDRATFAIGIYKATSGIEGGPFSISTNGSWSLQIDSRRTQKGSGADFRVGSWHTLSYVVGRNSVLSVALDGKKLVPSTIATDAVEAAEACDNSTFPYELTSTQVLGLGQNSSDADTPEKCQQAACAAGSDMWQFNTHDPKPPACWFGHGTSSQTGSGYVGRSRAASPSTFAGYSLSVTLDRYIYAAIDNFAITTY